jgi:pimeloyl-ACP methyl ester carboxylesterase
LKKVKKIVKIFFIVIGVLIIGLFVAAHILLKPASNEKVINELSKGIATPYIFTNNYKDFNYRVIAMQKELDTTLPTLVFVHGSPGSSLDYKRYFNDSILNKKANLITYDRIGYGLKNLGKIQGTLAFEMEILHDLIKDISVNKIILIGYSYGGPVILASNKNYKYKISLASAVVGEYEPMFGVLSLYKWKLTRPLVPAMLRAAAKEKYAHLTDLSMYKDKWNLSPSKVVNIQGDKDFIVPYKNSKFLEDTIDADKFTMVTIKGGGHDLIWTNFELIKSEILKTLN